MIDLQYVVLYVSSFVILLHRGRNGKPQGKKKRQERHETDKEKTVLCRVASELSLVPASLCRSIRQEEDFVWEMC